MSYNEKLLKTKLASIAHYRNEIALLDEAKKVTEATLTDLITTLPCPVAAGDVLLTPSFRTYKIVKVLYPDMLGKQVRYRIQYKRIGSYGNWDNVEDYVTLDDLLTYRHIGVDEELPPKTETP